ncbi:MAG: hypothetical protein K2G93_01675, partial [Rikenella sp.]|nr:hypothetical protein [Rikenella sp.]
MKRVSTLFILATLAVGTAAGAAKNDTTKHIKTPAVRFRFGGRLDAQVFSDSYTSKSSFSGLFYYFPLAPDYN